MSFCPSSALCRLLLAVLSLAGLSGCETLAYYSQSINGHFDLLNRARPVDEILSDKGVSESLRGKLKTASQLRQFAVDALGLPDNGSYRRYSQIDRDAVVWSVVAAPEFSLEPKLWCYPFIGCASYRGYFDHEDAEDYARQLQRHGYDVAIEPVPAYSSLGWSSDPIPSTVIGWPEADLAGLLFHELAHQQVYIEDDSAFNEAFATTVEQEGVKRWMQFRGHVSALDTWRARKQLWQAFLVLLLDTRERLTDVYDSAVSLPEKRRLKQQAFDQLKVAYQQFRQNHQGRGFDSWFRRGLNNARLVSVATYYKWVPAFQQLLLNVKGDLSVFYREVRSLGDMPAGQRHQRLMQLLAVNRKEVLRQAGELQ